jgi:hypothetical protein
MHNAWKLPKTDVPGPCSYENAAAYDKMVSQSIVSPHKSTLTRTAYTESYAKMKKFVPGVGRYKKVDNGFFATNVKTLEINNFICTGKEK